jgi:hypothetical protein
LVGLVDGDVQAGVADGVARRGESACVAELGEDGDRRQRADRVVAHQRPAAGLAAPVGTQLARQRRGLGVERVDDAQRDRDLLARRRWQFQALQPPALAGREQVASPRDAMVREHGLDALLPLAALVDERVTQTHAGAEIKHVLGRNPRLRQPSDHQQLPHVAGVGAIGLGPLLAAAQGACLGGLGEANVGADRPQFFHDESPAGCRLQRDLEVLAGKRPTNRRTRSRCAGVTRARPTSPVSAFSQSAVICARCWSRPITIAIWGLLTLHG